MTSPGYAAPRSLDEAVSLLAKNPNARVLAGGHGLLLEPNRSRIAGSLLVDLRRIPGLAGIERDAAGNVKIGAMTTLAALAEDAVIGKTYPALAEAARRTGDAQSRNRATVGGSLASTDPDADLPALGLLLDGTIQTVGPTGPRSLRAAELVTTGHRVLRADEVITALTIPAPAPRSGMAYEVHRNPATLAPLCGVAAFVTLGTDGAVSASRVVLVGAVPRAVRLPSVEQALAGKKPGDAVIASAAAVAVDGLAARSDLFASAEYRTHLAHVLTARALRQALARAAG
jgi:carbon-monoxide dehydrogenase medium subunit